MKVIIRETGKQETLELIDRKTGVDSVGDLIGNYDGYGDADYQFKYDVYSEVYTVSQETYDWWARVIGDQQALSDRIDELEDEHGVVAVFEAIGNAGDCDLEDQAASINAALDEVFGK